MARLYSNENCPLPDVERLCELGHDVLTCLEAGQANQGIPDEAVLAFAAADARCILTLNRRDFMRLHRDSGQHAGIIVCREDPDIAALAERVHAILDPDFKRQTAPRESQGMRSWPVAVVARWRVPGDMIILTNGTTHFT
jgi:hypothetical protein